MRRPRQTAREVCRRLDLLHRQRSRDGDPDGPRWQELQTDSQGFVTEATFTSSGNDGNAAQILDALETFLRHPPHAEEEGIRTASFLNKAEGDEFQFTVPEEIDIWYEKNGDGDLTAKFHIKVELVSDDAAEWVREKFSRLLGGTVAGLIDKNPDAPFAFGSPICLAFC
ncbi:hypothetical protein DPSP01_010207 [Paraphaeosphaeria sporulosa]